MAAAKGRKGAILKITITPKDASRKLKRIIPNYRTKWNKRVGKFATESHKAFITKINSRSGRTARSIRKKVNMNRTDMKARIIIDYTGTAVVFLDKGTRASPGRYMPWLGATGRRFRKDNPNKKGMHPGIRAQNIVSRALEDIKQLEHKLHGDLKRDYTKAKRDAFK